MDWNFWYQQWERYMSGAVPRREERFEAILDILALAMPGSFSALHVGCGPGSVTKRVLERFPEAKCTGIDFDPLFLKLAKETNCTERAHWADSNILSLDWVAQVKEKPFDAVIGTSVFHNLNPEQIATLYQQLAGIVRPGGLFLNADLFSFPATDEVFRELSDSASRANRRSQMGDGGFDLSKGWHQALKDSEPEVADLFEERERRLSFWETPGRINTSLEFHMSSLRVAGFSQVSVVWQYLNHRVVMAFR